MSYDPADDAGFERRNPAAERTSLPGIFLIIVGTLNLLLGLAVGGLAVVSAQRSDEEIQREIETGTDMMTKMFPSMKGELEKEMLKKTPKEIRTQGLIQNGGTGAFWVLSGLITFLGGIYMRSNRVYGLALTGAIVAAIPCISPLGCCGVGEAIGIWAIVVLLDAQVKAAFR